MATLSQLSIGIQQTIYNHLDNNSKIKLLKTDYNIIYHDFQLETINTLVDIKNKFDNLHKTHYFIDKNQIVDAQFDNFIVCDKCRYFTYHDHCLPCDRCYELICNCTCNADTQCSVCNHFTCTYCIGSCTICNIKLTCCVNEKLIICNKCNAKHYYCNDCYVNNCGEWLCDKC